MFHIYIPWAIAVMSILFQSFISCPVGIQTIGFVMAAYGCSTTVFALLLSRLSKYAGRYLLFAVAGAVNLVTLIVMYIWKPTSDHMALIYVVPIVWGLAEGIWQTQSNGMSHCVNSLYTGCFFMFLSSADFVSKSTLLKIYFR